MPSRNIVVRPEIGRSYSSGQLQTIHTALTYGENSTLLSAGHYGYPDFPPDRNVGGLFISNGIKTVQGLTTPNEHWRGGATDQYMRGSFALQVTGQSGSEPVTDGSAWGADAFNRMKPTKPSFNALNSIFELKDVPMMLKQRFHFNNLHELGDFHLALQFGWKALLQDVRNLVHAQRGAQDRLKWLLLHNGKPVRRKIELVNTMSDPVIASGTSYGVFTPVLVTQYYTRQPTWRQTDYTTNRVWAAARYRYWLPGGPRDIVWRRKMLARIFGFEPTPSVVYNAIPWSWLVDWFTNTGDLIENLEAGVADRLAADYFYVMRQTEKVRIIDGTGFFRRRNGEQFSVSATSSSTRFRRTRVVGDPFGWNTNQNLLNGMQLSILGALGLSRLR